MRIQEPRVEFVPIQPEMVARTSIECGPESAYNCGDSQVQSSWEGCGCSDGANESLVPCDSIV